MLRKRSLLVLGCLVAAVAVGTIMVRADSAAAITVTSSLLQYVKHVNELPEGVTTLDVRSTGPVGSTTLASIEFKARAEDGSNLSKRLFESFRGGQQKTIRINWGQPITDLNFIRIGLVRISGGGNTGGPGGGCPIESDGKVTICHYPPGNPGNAHTIRVGASAVPAHLAHGDSCGRCPNK